MLLGGVPGVPPAKVVVLGAGIVGTNAAKMFHAMGADLYILDTDLRKLQAIENQLLGRAHDGRLRLQCRPCGEVARTCWSARS